MAASRRPRLAKDRSAKLDKQQRHKFNLMGMRGFDVQFGVVKCLYILSRTRRDEDSILEA